MIDFDTSAIEHTRVIAGEPEEIEHSRWKICHRIPLLSETSTPLHFFNITTYSYEARQVELGGMDCSIEDIGAVSYFEMFNPILHKMERIRVSNDALVDEKSLKQLLREYYLELVI
jgi:hypothetical protein